MTKDEKSLLLAMSLGDGSISLRKYNNKISTAVLQITHTEAQIEYLKHKSKIINSIVGGKECSINLFKPTQGYKAKPSFRINKGHKYFKLLHRWLYSVQGKKYISKNILKRLTPEGIAIWYMDDGCLGKRKNKEGRITSFKCNLATYCTSEEADNIIEFFLSVYGVEWKKRLHKGSYYLETNSSNCHKFISIVEPYIIDCMKYKTPNFYFNTSAE